MAVTETVREEAAKAPKVEGDAVLLVAGEEAVVFSVHEDLIRKRSAFFEAAMSPQWLEAGTRRITFSDDCPAVIRLYVQYVYTGKLFTKPESGTLTSGSESEATLLAGLYVFGEKIIDVAFKNDVLAVFAHKATALAGDNVFPTNAAVDIIYRGTPQQSPARRMMVDMHTWEGYGHWISDSLDETNKEFLSDLVRSLLRRRAMPVARKPYLEFSNYYEGEVAKREIPIVGKGPEVKRRGQSTGI